MINNQLTKVYYQEALQEAADARAERNARPTRTNVNGLGVFIAALAVAGVPVAIWLFQTFKAG